MRRRLLRWVCSVLIYCSGAEVIHLCLYLNEYNLDPALILSAPGDVQHSSVCWLFCFELIIVFVPSLIMQPGRAASGRGDTASSAKTLLIDNKLTVLIYRESSSCYLIWTDSDFSPWQSLVIVCFSSLLRLTFRGPDFFDPIKKNTRRLKLRRWRGRKRWTSCPRPPTVV